MLELLQSGAVANVILGLLITGGLIKFGVKKLIELVFVDMMAIQFTTKNLLKYVNILKK